RRATARPGAARYHTLRRRVPLPARDMRAARLRQRPGAVRGGDPAPRQPADPALPGVAARVLSGRIRGEGGMAGHARRAGAGGSGLSAVIFVWTSPAAESIISSIRTTGSEPPKRDGSSLPGATS